MIKVSFEGYSDSEEYIDNTRIQVEEVAKVEVDVGFNFL